MEKKILALIGGSISIIFIITFIITSTILSNNSSKDNNVSKDEETNVNLIKEIQQAEDIKFSYKNFENFVLDNDFEEQFEYYVNKSSQIDKLTEDMICSGNVNELKFETNFSEIKIEKNSKVEVYKLPKNNLLEYFINEIYTSFNTVKSYDNIKNLVLTYKDKEKEIPQLKIKDFTEKLKFTKKLKQYEVDKLIDKDYKDFIIYLNVDDNEITIKTLSSDAIGIFYKEYESFYSIKEDLYDYLCDIFYLEREKETKSEDDTFDWVESIEIKDIINHVNETIDGQDAKDLLQELFKNGLNKDKMDENKYEVKKYTLKLKGTDKTENLIIYENYVQIGKNYYKVSNADLIIDSIIIDF